MRFLDFITNIITLSDLIIEGDADIIFYLQIEASGVSGDSAANIELLGINAEGDGEQLIYGNANFPIFQILAQNTNSADIEIGFEIEGLLTEPNDGLIQFPLTEVEAEGQSGNHGEFYFYLQVEGEGNANREYELCD